MPLDESVLTVGRLEASIRDALKKEIELIVAEETKRAQEAIQRKAADIAASIALRMTRFISVQSLRDEILIHVKLEDVR